MIRKIFMVTLSLMVLMFSGCDTEGEGSSSGKYVNLPSSADGDWQYKGETIISVSGSTVTLNGSPFAAMYHTSTKKVVTAVDKKELGFLWNGKVFTDKLRKSVLTKKTEDTSTGTIVPLPASANGEWGVLNFVGIWTTYMTITDGKLNGASALTWDNTNGQMYSSGLKINYIYKGSEIQMGAQTLTKKQ